MYLPPFDDTGPIDRHAQFIFSVTDHYDNTLMDESFDVTITPVNNQAPQIRVGDITVQEGSHKTLSTNHIQAFDMDTEAENLLFIVKRLPAYGALLTDDAATKLGASFRLSDLDLGRIR